MLKKNYVLSLSLVAVLTVSSIADCLTTTSKTSKDFGIHIRKSPRKCHQDGSYIDFSEAYFLSEALSQLSLIECQYYYVDDDSDIELPRLTPEESRILSINSWQELKSFIKGRKDIVLTRNLVSGIYKVTIKKCSRDSDRKEGKFQISQLSGMTPGSILYYLEEYLGYDIKCNEYFMKKINDSKIKLTNIKNVLDIKEEFRNKLNINLTISRENKVIVCSLVTPDLGSNVETIRQINIVNSKNDKKTTELDDSIRHSIKQKHKVIEYK